MTATWLGAAREELATTRILDAAGELFARDGVAPVGMAEVAEAAGCSRATLYRYFPKRDALRGAFVRREARRLGDELARKVAQTADPAKRFEAAVLGAVAAGYLATAAFYAHATRAPVPAQARLNFFFVRVSGADRGAPRWRTPRRSPGA